MFDAAPVVEQHNGIFVVRDDLLPGGTKSRYLYRLFEQYDEVVYASPAYGGAQLALAVCAHVHGKRAVIFVAKRKVPHARTLEAHALGARVFQVPHGYLSHVQSAARRYCEDTGAHYLEFGAAGPAPHPEICSAAAAVAARYGPFSEVWSAAGSGVLTRGLQSGITDARFVAVQIGRDVETPGRAEIIKHPYPFEKELNIATPFPSCPNYDRKAWQICQQRKGAGPILFWNVLGPSPTGAQQSMSNNLMDDQQPHGRQACNV